MEQNFLSCQIHAACFHFKWTNSAKTHFVLHISRFAFQKFNQASLLARIFASALFQGPPWFPTFFSHLIANFEFQVIPCIHSSKVFQAYNDRNQSESFLLDSRYIDLVFSIHSSPYKNLSSASDRISHWYKYLDFICSGIQYQ